MACIEYAAQEFKLESRGVVYFRTIAMFCEMANRVVSLGEICFENKSQMCLTNSYHEHVVS